MIILDENGDICPVQQSLIPVNGWQILIEEKFGTLIDWVEPEILIKVRKLPFDFGLDGFVLVAQSSDFSSKQQEIFFLASLTKATLKSAQIYDEWLDSAKSSKINAN
jgi:hypothetical protein